MPDLPEYLLKAYDLFKEEFAKHIDYFSNLEPTQEILTENAEEICRRFHTIKGGAGFLELPEVVRLAKAGEALFRKFSYTDENRSAFVNYVKDLRTEGEKFE